MPAAIMSGVMSMSMSTLVLVAMVVLSALVTTSVNIGRVGNRVGYGNRRVNCSRASSREFQSAARYPSPPHDGLTLTTADCYPVHRERYPRRLHESYETLATAAFHEAWPCK
jgi:hypothetical protein